MRLSLVILTVLSTFFMGCPTKTDSDETGGVDADNDGYTAVDDCDDANATVNRGATETCNGVDDNCNDVVDDGVSTLYYADGDTDGFGDAATSQAACYAPTGYVEDATDCDDGDAGVNPGAAEVCDGLDNDCDGDTDDDDDSVSDPTTWYNDYDSDGYGDPNNSKAACEAPANFVDNGDDCDDNDPRFHPGADESDCTDINDYNCDGSTGFSDADADGFPACEDCDDANAAIHGGAAEVCDDLDNDCDGLVDDADSDVTGGTPWYADGDADGYGNDLDVILACESVSGRVELAGDCDDGDPRFHPGADETDCTDPSDYNCDGSTGFSDGDSDGFAACEDCDDEDAAIFPGAAESCDGVDNDCDLAIDEEGGDLLFYPDADGDGYGDALGASVTSCSAPDGYVADSSDCNDADNTIWPGAPELCDGLDNDCDGEVDGEGSGTSWYQDADADGFGDSSVVTVACAAPEGFVGSAGDCDDTDAGVNPLAEELCDGVDQDCDGLLDQTFPYPATTAWYADRDADGFGGSETTWGCEQPAGFVDAAGDCDDEDGAVFPGATEVCDSIDNDCDGAVDAGAPGSETFYHDADADGYGSPLDTVAACSMPEGYTTDASDCDDTSAAVHPGVAELCDGLDNDCSGVVDDGAIGSAWYADADGDGFGDPSMSVLACAAPEGYGSDATDCDDGDAAVYPGALDACDGLDNDCSGVADDGTAGATWYADADADGYGDPLATVVACTVPGGYTDDASDCDDTTAAVFPGAAETCNGLDDDCDGSVDDGVLAGGTFYADGDGDGYGDADTSVTACAAPTGYVTNATDCDDSLSAVNPGASEYCNSIDDNCDGRIDGSGAVDGYLYYFDRDYDGYGSTYAGTNCRTAVSGYSRTDGDCDDATASVNPGATELCNSLDDNCDGVVDTDAADFGTWYADLDGDGWGDDATATSGCSAPSGYITASGDCDDADAELNPGVEEECDAVDNDCDGESDEVCPWCDTIVPVEVATIQGAIDAAVSGEDICVMAGTWVENLDFKGKAITVESIDGYTETILDGGAANTVVTFKTGEKSTSVLRGFTITNGSATYGGAFYMKSVSPTLEDLDVTGNTATYGGGFLLDTSAPTLTNVQVTDNYGSYGGGFNVSKSSHLQMENVDVSWNSTATHGGAVYMGSSTLTVTNGRFEHNSATGASADHGGAIYASSSTLNLTNVLVSDNVSAKVGAGLYCYSTCVQNLNQVVVYGNAAGTWAGGMYVGGGSTVSIINSVIAANTAVSGGGGVYVYTSSGTTMSVSYSDTYGNTPDDWVGMTDPAGTLGNLSVDPAFVDGPGDNFHLQTTSPLIDAGSPSSLDPDGTTSDIGIYGGPNAGLFDIDDDGWYRWWTPGDYEATKDAGYDCDDTDPSVYPGAGC